LGSQGSQCYKYYETKQEKDGSKWILIEGVWVEVDDRNKEYLDPMRSVKENKTL
jgi:hypothetical protein